MSDVKRDEVGSKSKRSVLVELPLDVYARLAKRAHDNDRSVKAEAERIVRLTIAAGEASGCAR